MTLISILQVPTVADNWLLGFADAEGCFSCTFLANLKHRFRFLIAQSKLINKPVLTQLAELLLGKVYDHSQINTFEMVVNGTRNMQIVYSYFDKRQFITTKAASYKLWREIGVAIDNKEHLDLDKRAILKAKAATVNASRRAK